jgi:putative chitinase
MTVSITPEQIAQLAPSARSSYRDAFAAGQPVLEQYGIAENPLRVAHFIAQVMHESGGLTLQFENLNYSAQRLPKVWPKRFLPLGPLDPEHFAHNAERLANEVYGQRMGNSGAGDGFRYRGRGLLQLTGRDSYVKATKILRETVPEAPDFAADPDATIATEWCLQVAAAVWASKGCNALADNDSIQAVTRAVNGGLVGLGERTEWSVRTKFIWS